MATLATGVRAGRRILGKAVRRVPWLRRRLLASTDSVIVSREEALNPSKEGWMRSATARRQEAAYNRLLRQMHAGSPRVDLEVAAEAVRSTASVKPFILEVGCGGGYYTEVFDHLLGAPYEYLGIDFSRAMIDRARRRYPGRRFELGDACNLGLPAESVDIAFDGVTLMHVVDYERAVREARRVARAFCIYHSVPVFDDGPTTYLRKFAYGERVTEVVFNRDELLQCFHSSGLAVERTWRSITYDVFPATPQHSYCETFLLRVADPAPKPPASA